MIFQLVRNVIAFFGRGYFDKEKFGFNKHFRYLK